MGLPLYLAMTAAELSRAALPERCAYMACHFSPYGTGLANIPDGLPEKSILMVNDRTPVHRHDPQCIAKQLQKAAAHLKAEAVILDFQRPGEALTQQIAAQICRELTVPVAISEYYARELECDVFANAPPLTASLAEHLQLWQGRKIWLEASYGSALYCVTERGCKIQPAPLPDEPQSCHAAPNRFCHYRTRLLPDRAEFTVFRTREDLEALLQQARELGVCAAVGLYQELGAIPSGANAVKRTNGPL